MDKKDKKTFLLYYDQSQIWEGLSDERAGILIKLLHKKLDSLPTNTDPLVKYAYFIIKKKINTDYDKWLKKCIKNQENIKKRWNKERKQSNTTVSNPIRSGTNYTDNDNVNDNDNEF